MQKTRLEKKDSFRKLSIKTSNLNYKNFIMRTL